MKPKTRVERKSAAVSTFHFSQRDFLIALFLGVAFFFTRIVNLRLWPIFTDEAIYTRWSQIGLHDAAFRFISLTDGKQPLWHWTAMGFMKFIADPLLAGRLVSVFSGFAAMVGIWFLTFELFSSKKAAFISSYLYLITPSVLIYDRMAIVDSMLSLWGIWTLYFGIKTAKLLRFDLALLTGFALGAGLLTKSPAAFLEYLYFLNLLFLKNRQQFKKWILLLFPTLTVAEGMRNIMRLSPWMHMISQKNSEFLVSFPQFLKDPFHWFWGNLPSLWRWWLGSLTLPVMLLVILGLVLTFLSRESPLSLRRHSKSVFYLLFFSFSQFLAFAALGKVIFARYLLFLTPPLLTLAAAAVAKICTYTQKTFWLFIFFLSFSLAAGSLDLLILTDPLRAPIVKSDKDQYINGHSAGWGVPEVISYLQKESRTQSIFLGTQGTFGLMPASFELYLWDNKNIKIRGYWPVSRVPDEVVEIAEKMPTYFIYYESDASQIPQQDNLQLLEKYQKGSSDKYMYFFRVLPK